MIEVTKDQFFAALYADKRDIMPRNSNPLHTDWETPDRQLFGRTYPGWRNPGNPKRYMLTAEAAKTVGAGFSEKEKQEGDNMSLFEAGEGRGLE